MEVKTHGPPKPVIPLGTALWLSSKQGLIDRYNMLAEKNHHMKFQIQQNKEIMKEIKKEIDAIDGRC